MLFGLVTSHMDYYFQLWKLQFETVTDKLGIFKEEESE
jgi:hypothetical protein